MSYLGKYGVSPKLAVTTPSDYVRDDFSEVLDVSIVEGDPESLLVAVTTVGTEASTFLILTVMANTASSAVGQSNFLWRVAVNGVTVMFGDMGGAVGTLSDSVVLNGQTKIPSPTAGNLVCELFWTFTAITPASDINARRASILVQEVRV